jgi:hypothetical protein
MRAKTLKSHTLIASAETHLDPKRRLKVVGNSRKSSQRLRAAGQKFQHTLFVDLVANGPHVVTVGDVEHLRARDNFTQGCG